jgi:hypothetical protein
MVYKVLRVNFTYSGDLLQEQTDAETVQVSPSDNQSDASLAFSSAPLR